MSEYLGRPLKESEVVHHKDEDRLNNDITNLELMSRSDHAKFHMKDYEIDRCNKGRIKTIKRVQHLPQVEAEEIEYLTKTERGIREQRRKLIKGGN